MTHEPSAQTGRFRASASAMAVLILAGGALADDLHVPTQFPTIQQAIDAAQNGDVVILADGLYQGEGNRDVRFLGKAITVRSANGPLNCIIDAQGTSENPYRGFIFDSGETTDAVLDGVTVSGGATPQGAVQDQFNGGGLFFSQGSATIMNCIISDNACGCWGGGVYVSFGAAPVFINCDISNNFSNDDGGAVFVWNNGSATLINCSMTNNYARVSGGAISDFGATQVTVINSTMAANEAPFGSALLGWQLDVHNSIIWGNVGGDPIYSNSADASYSIVEGGYAGIGNLDVDPQFVDPDNRDFSLRPGSAAIDAGNSDAVPAGVGFDLLGNARFHDDPGMIDTGAGNGPIVDIGAVEFPGTSAGAASLTDAVVTVGSWMEGDLADLQTSDDQVFRARSGFGRTLSETHLSDVAIAAHTDHARPSRLNLTLESSISHSAGQAKLLLWNVQANQYDFVGSAPVGSSETVLVVNGIDATNYVDAGGNIHLSLKHVVHVPFLAFQFEVSIDQVQIEVN